MVFNRSFPPLPSSFTPVESALVFPAAGLWQEVLEQWSERCGAGLEKNAADYGTSPVAGCSACSAIWFFSTW